METLTGQGDLSATCVTHLSMPSLKREQVRYAVCSLSALCVVLRINCLVCFSGYGGGFNERENVEYIEREESDGEYDEVSLTFK